MRHCVLCGSPCRNRCASCGRGWCAICRDAAGSASCNDCVAKFQQRKAAAKASVQQRRVIASAPVYVPSQPVRPPASVFPGQGKSWYEMTDDEQYDWLLIAIKVLEATIEHDMAYLARRAARGTSTATDALLSGDAQGLQAILETLQLELDEYLIGRRPASARPKEATGDLNMVI